MTNGALEYCNPSDATTARFGEVRAGVYKSVDDVMRELQKVAFRNQDNSKMSWFVDESTQALNVKFNQKFFIRLVGPDLRSILGYDLPIQQGNKKSTPPQESTYPIDIQAGRHTMFVYYDLVQDEVLGDIRAPLLRAVPLLDTTGSSGNQSLTVYKAFKRMQFKKVVKSTFHSVNIELRDEGGSPVPFLGTGRTNVTLLFKRDA